MLDGINNREIASLFWLAVILAWTATRPGGREAIRGVLRAVAHPFVLGPIILLGGWVASLSWLAAHLGLWDDSVTGATAVWVLTVGIGMLTNVGAVSDREHWFRREIGKALGLTAFSEAFLNVAVFPLPVEFILVPTLTFLVMMSTFADGREELTPAKGFVDGLLATVGVVMAVLVVVRLVLDLDDLGGNGRNLALPVWLTLGTLPFIYVVGLFSAYQTAFAFLAAEEPDAPWRARGALLLGLGLNASTVGRFRVYAATQVAEADSWNATNGAVREFRRSLHEENEAFEAAERAIEERAGLPGTDEEGRRLDRREFADTKSALQSIAIAQLGWFERAPKDRYRPDLLGLLGPLRGLPENHGVSLRVSDDGQAWYAWRRTVTGWCFAIGASEAPPDEWLYDGPEPPQGFPGRDPVWGERWGLEAVNWMSTP